ncbi:Ribonuclease P protein subunit p21 [Boothiomyces sp. JEL0866]|nr:Ribonuclease P protein subunit p21 [Boothiomyces sp. JEL0866]
MAKKKQISIQNKDIYQRMNFLYQAQLHYKHLLPSYFAKQMKQVGRKVVLRIDPSIKRTICKKCSALLDFVEYNEKAVLECSVCGTRRQFGNKPLNKNPVDCRLAKLDCLLDCPDEEGTKSATYLHLGLELPRRSFTVVNNADMADNPCCI